MKTTIFAAIAAIAVAAPASADVLFDQTTGGSYANRYVSQIFTDPSYAGAYDAAIVDDFTLANGASLSSVTAAMVGYTSGFQSFTDIQSYTVNIYSSQAAASANLIGDLYTFTIKAAGATVNTNAFTITEATQSLTVDTAYVTIPIDVLLNSGTYFLSVTALNDDNTNGQTAVAVNSPGSAVIANPGGGYNQGNPIFLGRSAGYRIDGDVTPAAVPEPATWAMMIMGFGLVGGAMRRRTTRVRFA